MTYLNCCFEVTNTKRKQSLWKIAAFLRQHPSEAIEQARFGSLFGYGGIFNHPAGERELRKVFTSINEDRPNPQALVEAVEALGLEPCKPPKPLPPIEPDEIHLIHWMGIEAQDLTS